MPQYLRLHFSPKPLGVRFLRSLLVQGRRNRYGNTDTTSSEQTTQDSRNHLAECRRADSTSFLAAWPFDTNANLPPRAIGISLMRRRAPYESLFRNSGCRCVSYASNAGYTAQLRGPLRRRLARPALSDRSIPVLCVSRRPGGSSPAGDGGGIAHRLAAAMVLATATEPWVGAHETNRWLTDVRRGDLRVGGLVLGAGHGWLTIVPFVVLCAALAAIAIHRTLAGSEGPLRSDLRSVVRRGCVASSVYGSSMFYEHSAPWSGSRSSLFPP